MFAPKLNRKFALLALSSWTLGVREWYLAYVLVFQPELLLDYGYVNPDLLPMIAFEATFLVAGGLLLIGWPIAYRKLQWAKG